MPAQPVCPYCGGKLFPHELTNDQCASCGGRLSGAVGWLPPPREERREEETPPRLDRPLTLPGRPPPEAFAAVRQGVHLVRWGVASNLVFSILAAAGQLTAANLSDLELKRFAQAVWLFGAAFQIGSALVILLGVFFCCVVPKGCGARKWVRCMVPCLVVGGILLLGSVAVGIAFYRAERGGPIMPPDVLATLFALMVLAVVGHLASLFYFLLLGALARFCGNESLAKSIMAYCYCLLAICDVGLVGTFIALAIAADAPPPSRFALPFSIGDAAICAWLAAGVILSFWLLGLLRRLHRLLPVPDEPDQRKEFPAQRWS